jgi:hypothetical protein
MEREAGVLEHRPDLDRELLLAVAAAPEAEPDSLRRVGGYLGDPVHAAAMRAGFPVRPDDALKVLESLGFVVKFGAGKDGRSGAPDVLFS